MLHLAHGLPPRQRVLVEFALDRPVAPTIVTYMNRLSDWLFVMAPREQVRRSSR